MKIQTKLKKCKACGNQFQPFSSLAKACSIPCSLIIVEHQREKKHRKEAIKWRKDNKKISDWIAEAQSSINAYVRVRDHNDACISCGFIVVKTYLTGGAWHAGHFRSRGSAGHLRFHLHNIHKQCAECNIHKSGKVDDYRVRLIEKIGIDKVESLEVNNGYKKFTREHCEKIKRIFNKKTRIKKKQLGLL